jgi:diguanylate cyclase (GGDEF)-like protein
VKPNLKTTPTEVETGVDLVRLVLALVACAVAVGNRAADGDALDAVVSVAIIAAVALGLSSLRRLTQRVSVPRAIGTIVLQGADTIAAVGLVVVVSGSAKDSGWSLLAVPIVIASLRHNAIGVLGSWTVASTGYLTVLWFDIIEPGPEAFDTAIVVERPGTLLAVAAAVAVMTRWLQQGWHDQAQATLQVKQHLGYVRTVEQAGRAMRQRSSDEIINITLEHLLHLGFGAATLGTQAGQHPTIGSNTYIPPTDQWPSPESGAIEVTEWVNPNGQTRYSTSILEPRSGQVLTGWSTEDPTGQMLASLTDLTAYTTASIELTELLETARFEAEHDPLTRLYNRAALKRHLDNVTSQNQPIALLFIDVDNFKQINDTHGHQIGDTVLIQVADTIHTTAPDHAMAARFGGDEFVIALHGSDAEAATDVAYTLWSHHQRPLLIDDAPLEVQISIGVGTGHGPIDPGELALRADTALYQAKEAGRNTVRTHRRQDNNTTTQRCLTPTRRV